MDRCKHTASLLAGVKKLCNARSWVQEDTKMKHRLKCGRLMFDRKKRGKNSNAETCPAVARLVFSCDIQTICDCRLKEVTDA